MKTLKLWTRTNYDVSVFVDGELRSFEIQYHGTTPFIIVDGTWYAVARLQ